MLMDTSTEHDLKTYIADLKKRTEEHFRQWFRERGLDYDTMTEEEFYAIVDEAIQKFRKSHEYRQDIISGDKNK